MYNCQSSTSTMPAQIRIYIKWHVRIHLCIHVRLTTKPMVEEEGGGGGEEGVIPQLLGNCFWTQECISRSLSLLVSVWCRWVWMYEREKVSESESERELVCVCVYVRENKGERARARERASEKAAVLHLSSKKGKKQKGANP